jgi:regulation of enolase protein 1 (concanavalin A-like superfamily)
MNGDGSISVRVSSQGDTDPWAKAGLAVRASTDQGAAYFGIFTTPETNGTVIQYRPTAGAATTQISGVTTKAPVYLKISRSGNTFTAYTSSDGVTWTAFPNGSVSIPAIPANALAGMESTSHSQFNTNTVNFDSFTLTPNNLSLPSPWVDNDIDNATPAGSATFANNVFTVNGGGNDIWGTAYGNLDQMHYVSQSLSGDGSIVARVTSQTNTSAWAKAGVMIKQSATADAPYALLAVTPGNGVSFQSGFSSSTSGGNFTLPEWLKLTRTGNTITAFTSTDGTTWNQVGTTTVTMSAQATIGLFVSSHNAGTASAVNFDNVTVNSTGTTSGLPAPWTDADIDNATPAGSATFANNVFTVNGGGNDIWGTADRNLDQFHYVYQPLTGNGTITARVTSQTNTSAWAKAGVMVKQSTTTGSNYALIGVTPGNGITFQYNFTGSVGGGNYTFPNAWVRLQRVGNTLTASASSDGAAWTQVGSTTVTLNDPVTVGLFVTSHNAGSLSAVTFDNVSVTNP